MAWIVSLLPVMDECIVTGKGNCQPRVWKGKYQCNSWNQKSTQNSTFYRKWVSAVKFKFNFLLAFLLSLLLNWILIIFWIRTWINDHSKCSLNAGGSNLSLQSWLFKKTVWKIVLRKNIWYQQNYSLACSRMPSRYPESNMFVNRMNNKSTM